MKRRIFAVAALLGSLQLLSAADITGKITLKGTPPPEKEIPLDPTCGKLHAEKLTTRLYVVAPDGGLADVFVYLKEGVSNKGAAPGKPVILDQRGCEYFPYVGGLQTGQTLVVKNSDPVLHNVHVMPDPATGNKESNKAQLPKPGGADLNFTFTAPEVLLRFKCDVHNWMYSYFGVVDHPYFAVTEKDGTFKIANVPPGTYTVEALHRKAGAMTQKVTVEKDNKTADFTLQVKAQ